MVVLGDASVSHLVEAEDTLQDAEDMFYFVRLQVISWAFGAACWMAFVWPW